MKYYLSLLIKGIFIGIAKIIPGVSGSLLAISLNVYDIGLNALTKYFSNIRRNTFIIFFLGAGILCSILLCSKIVYLLLNKYYYFTMMFFLGIISGSYKSLLKNITISKKNIIIISITLILSILILSINIDNKFVIKDDIYNYFIFFIGGIMEMMGTLIPGISSSSLLMILGIYDVVILMVSNIYNINYIITNLNIILPFVLGMIISLILLSNIILYLLNNYKEVTYSVIIGIYLSTLILLIFKILNKNISNIFIGIVLYIISFISINIIEK